MEAVQPQAAQFAYRLVVQSEWEAIQKTGSYVGSPLDIKDGFLHMSPFSEVQTTANHYFAGQTDVVLLEVQLRDLLPHIRWDYVPSRDASFPHLYGMLLPSSAVARAWVLVKRADGTFEIPDVAAPR